MRCQKMTEASRFIYLLGSLGCKSYLEIGAREGDTFLAIGSCMDRALAIDLPGKGWGQSGSEKILTRRCKDLNEKLGVEAKFLMGDSTLPWVVNYAKNYAPFDAIFIDGSHAYKDVKRDYENYFPMATKVCAFHDIIGESAPVNKVGGKVEVQILWSELKGMHENTVEFAETWGGRPMGIGAIIK